LFALVDVWLCDGDIVGLKDAIGKAIVNCVGIDDVCGFLSRERWGVGDHVLAYVFESGV
jgi:hypothetical protein